MQPTAQAVGESRKKASPSGAKDQFLRTHKRADPLIGCGIGWSPASEMIWVSENTSGSLAAR
jgi:hypothetical protein